MRRRFALTKGKRKQGGYALLLVVFLTALLLVSTMEIGLRTVTEGRREKEQDMIWRGKQYTRGIKLYYQKYGRFPTSLDNLTKPQTGNIRFMRQAYKDPMNKDDGAWRLIYVGPAGNLIGSLKPPTSLQMPVAGQPGGGIGAASSSGFGSFGSTSPGGATTTTGFGGFGAPAQNAAPPAGMVGAGTGAQSADSNGGAPATPPAPGNADPNVPMTDTPTIVGGNIIGIGSKINQSSVIVYEKATNYRLFEFVWDPSKDLGMISTSSTGPGQSTGTTGSTPGTGNGMGTGTGTQPSPFAPQQPPTAAPPANPNQQQQPQQ
jgi:hypothetical protein